LATAAAFVSTGTLLFTAWSHARDFRGFLRALEEHRVWPQLLVRFVAAAVLLLEGALGLAVLAGLSALSHPFAHLGVTLLLVAGLFAAFGVYGAFLAAFRPGVSCGCSGVNHPVSSWVSARAFLLSIGALFSAVNVEQVMVLRNPSAGLVIAAVASFAFAILLWTFPLALANPHVVGQSQGLGASHHGEGKLREL